MSRPLAPATALLGLITLAFLSLGLPDGSFGVAWPRMHLDLALPLGLALGTGLATGIIQSVNTETVRLPLVFTAYTYSFAVLIVILASVASALVVLRKLSQLDLIGALKAPE